jgi:lipoprotein NlpI
MVGRIGLLALVAAFAFALPAHAQQRQFWRQQQLSNCSNTEGAVTAEVSLRACTAIIRAQGSPDTLRAQAFNFRAQRHLSLGQADRALQDFSQAIRTNPQFTEAYYNRAEFYLDRGQFARAVVDYNDVIRIEPESPEGYNARCWARALWNASLELARADCNQALMLAPQGANFFDSRGMVGLREGRWQDAFNDYDAAVSIEQHPHYLFGRGVAAIRLGRTAEGEADIAAAEAQDASIRATYAGYGITP